MSLNLQITRNIVWPIRVGASRYPEIVPVKLLEPMLTWKLMNLSGPLNRTAGSSKGRQRWAMLAMLFCLAPSGARADIMNMGILSYNTTIPGAPGAPGTVSINVANLTGPASLPPDFDISTSLRLLNPSLLVRFVGGATQTIDLPQIDA